MSQSRWASYLAGALVLTWMVLGVASVVRCGSIFVVYMEAVSWATTSLGLDYYGANLLAVGFTSIAIVIIPYIVAYLALGIRRREATVAALSITVVVFCLVYALGSQVNFDRATGRPIRWYADTPNGRVYSFSPGFDPAFGIQFKPVTIDAVAQDVSRKPQPLAGAPAPYVLFSSWHERLKVRGSFPPVRASKWECNPATGAIACAFRIANATQADHYVMTAVPVTVGNLTLSGTWRIVEESAPGVPLASGTWRPRWSEDGSVLQGNLEFSPACRNITAETRASPFHVTITF